jgi:glycosyltransferase involved in cell wall biosynthesis/GT2 family glycosyltransferase
VPDVTTVVTLYDLIPLAFEDHYLRDPTIGTRYHARANLVRAADHVLAISEATAHDAGELLGVAPEKITVIDAGVSGAFLDHSEDASDARATLRARFPEIRDGFMLYVAGIEFRKNIDRLIGAYGLMDPDLRALHQLVVTCKVLPEERAHLERVKAKAGLAPDEVVITGYVDDTVLAALYRLTRLFVFASFYEGSGLPILEAMACGVPVAASNTSTSPEILGDLEATFDPFDRFDMARTLTNTLGDDALLERLRGRSRERVRHYTWDHVAERTLEGYEQALAARRRRARRAPVRPRVALFTPWPPEQSGIADYNQRLVPHLARHADVDVVVEGDEDYVDPDVDGARIVPVEDFEWWAHDLQTYDALLYCMGNSHFHGWIYEAMKERPGVLVAHDVRLTGFYGWYAGEERPEDPPGRLAERIHGMYGERVDWRTWRDRPPTPEEQQAYGLYMTHEVQEYAHTAIVHSRYAAEILRLDRPPERRVDPTLHVIPHAMPVLPPDFRQPWVDTPLVVSFGVLSHIKGLQTLLEAFAQVATRHPTTRLMLAGYGDPGDIERWTALAEELGIADRVEVPGYVTAQQYREFLSQASVAVQLRLTSNGEASGAVANSLAAGLPTIVTDIGWFGELPRDAVVHVPVGVTPGALSIEIERLLDDEGHARAVARGGLRHAEEASFPFVARRYLEAALPARGQAQREPLRPARVTVAIITRDRRDRLMLALQALERQTSPDFAVVVADFGSTDGTHGEVDRLARGSVWRGRLELIDVPPARRSRGAARNVAAANAAPGSSLILFVDVDVVLSSNAVERIASVHDGHPEAIILPAVHWLEPLDVADVESILAREGAPALLRHVRRGPARRVHGTIVGADPRSFDGFAPAAEAGERRAEPELAVSTVLGFPASAFEDLGGYDEAMTGYGYEDMEFGIRVAARGTPAVQLSDVYGLHVWHAKHDWGELSVQNERNLDYVLRKHGSDATSDEWADWSVWWHYHADREGRVARSDGALWAVDRGNRFKLALPSEHWVARLGFGMEDVAEVEPGELEELRDAGVAEDPAEASRAVLEPPVRA